MSLSNADIKDSLARQSAAKTAANKKVFDDKVDKCNKKLNDFNEKIILEEGLVLRGVKPLVFIDGVRFEPAELRFFPAPKKMVEDIKAIQEKEKKEDKKKTA